MRKGGKRSAWDSEKQRLTAMQWLVACWLGMPGKKIKPATKVKGQDQTVEHFIKSDGRYVAQISEEPRHKV